MFTRFKKIVHKVLNMFMWFKTIRFIVSKKVHGFKKTVHEVRENVHSFEIK